MSRRWQGGLCGLSDYVAAMPSQETVAAVLGAAEIQPLARLFADDPTRVERFAHELAGIRFDFSKTHLTPELLARLPEIAEQVGLDDALERLFTGEIVNPTESRAAEHPAERGHGSAEAVQLATHRRHRMRGLIDAIEAGAFGDVTGILHIGIGGSALGPALLLDALGRRERRYKTAVLSNIDGEAFDTAVADLDPATTLVAIASKTFTTAETLRNAQTAIEWLGQGGVEDPYGRLIGITSAPERAVEFGIDETRVLPFAESIGGRYSLWSAIGCPAALALGVTAFEELLEGAAALDEHVRDARPEANIPLIAAVADRLYVERLGASGPPSTLNF